jgi:hypothetical protein
MVSASEIIAVAEARGARFEIVGTKLRAVPAAAISEELRIAIGQQKPAVIAELRRRESRGGSLCTRCKRIGLVRLIDRVCRRCAADEEWRLDGCAHFTVLRYALDAREAAAGACLACGASHKLHGRPEPGQWRRVDDSQDVELVAVRYVLARAARIANAHT